MYEQITSQDTAARIHEQGRGAHDSLPAHQSNDWPGNNYSMGRAAARIWVRPGTWRKPTGHDGSWLPPDEICG